MKLPNLPLEPSIFSIWCYLTNCKDGASGSVEHFRSPPVWPPDVFGLVAALLKKSGAYTRQRIAPGKDELKGWIAAAREWRERLNADAGAAEFSGIKFWPDSGIIASEWGILFSRGRDALSVCVADSRVLRAMTALLVMSDEASKGLGFPCQKDQYAYSEFVADKMIEPMEFGSTLSFIIHPSVSRVLPKAHVSQRGYTLRSMSHYLCYIETDEVRPVWYSLPGGPPSELNSTKLNILVVPWPEIVADRQFFDPANSDEHFGRTENFAHGWFDYNPADTHGEITRRILRLVRIARERTGTVDLVILPEVSICASDYVVLRTALMQERVMLMTGIGGFTQEGVRENRVGFDIPISRSHAVHLRQRKHHRWALDRSQIQQYSLGSQLGTSRILWESIDVDDRQLHFVALRPWLLTTVLICEDLARHDPVGELLCSVGPNLVIALLMDGPQIGGRWPDRYASVLAGDPGCSVLSVTSLGMSRRSSPKAGSASRSRSVALWRDTTGNLRELELEGNSNALLLTLEVEDFEEWTADLRIDREHSFYPVLSSVLQISDPGGAALPFRKLDDSVTYLSPGEASALGRLAQCGSSTADGISRVAASDLKSEQVGELMSRLGDRALRIASGIWDRRDDSKSRQEHSAELEARDGTDSARNVDGGAVCDGRPGGTAFPDPVAVFRELGLSWVEDDREESIRETADSILAWRRSNVQFGEMHRRKLAQWRESIPGHLEGE